jgi:hypothetical protein
MILGTRLVVTDVADDDVVEIELDGGLKRWIRGSDLESELGVERKRGVDVVQIPSTLPRAGRHFGTGETWDAASMNVRFRWAKRSSAGQRRRAESDPSAT